MNKYNWQQKDWREFKYDLSSVEENLFRFAEKTGHVTGVLFALPESTQMEAIIENMVWEAVKTSEIEGEYLNRKDVMSSIKNNLALNNKIEPIKDKLAKGIGELMIDVRNTFKDSLSIKKLFDWHTMLMGENTQILTGALRMHDEPIQVISRAMGKEKIHFEAPPSKNVAEEMDYFIDWFNKTAPGGCSEIKKAPVRSAIAHLYFESIHPFEDGNGRIGRALSEKALSQGLGRPVLLSISLTIEKNKKKYYDALEIAQRSNEVSLWINYFVNTILEAQINAEVQIKFLLKKTKFFDKFNNQLNHRQIKVIKRIFEEEPQGFEGGINTSKYISLTKVSKATATRDLQDLLERGAIALFDGGGRSTRYYINL